MSVLRMGNNNKNRWSTDEVFELIEVVKNCGCIYNSRDKNYYSRTYIENVWHDIDIKFAKNPGSSLSKWTNLRISFRREYMMLMKEHTKPSWIFFEKMLFLQQFLRRKKPRVAKLETHIQDALVQINSITRGNFKNHIENVEHCDPEPSEPDHEPEEISEESWNQNFMIKNVEIISGEEEEEEEILEIRDSESSAGSENGAELEETVKPEQMANELNENSMEKKPIEIVIKESSNLPSSSSLETSCACKSNADAMFLMSLMPDIQLLSRKDKGNFKIQVQKIIQDLLYPD